MNFQIKNFSIKKFNNDVNHSGDLDDKFLKWSSYRKNVSDFVCNTLNSKLKSQNIIVFGAGVCNDIDLHFLAEKFDKIVLTDVDTKSISEGIKRQSVNIEEADKINIVNAEYSSLESNEFFKTLSGLVNSRAPIEIISSFIKKSIDEIKPNLTLDVFKNTFDVVLCCPTYTQIVYTQAEVLFKILKQFNVCGFNQIEELNSDINKLMPNILKGYNDLMLSVMVSDGKIVVLSDVVEILAKDDMLAQLKKRLSVEPIDEDELEIFVKECGLDLGKTGLEDLFNKIDKQNTLWTIWPFDEFKEYLVFGVIGRKKRNSRFKLL